MENPTAPSDVAARWRPLSDAEAVIVPALLDDAWAIVKHHISDVETRLDAVPATLDVALVRAVLANMVIRVLRNPDGKASESIDDYRFTRDPAGKTGALALTDDEFDLLTPSSARGAFSIRPAYVPDDLSSMHAWWESQ